MPIAALMENDRIHSTLESSRARFGNAVERRDVKGRAPIKRASIESRRRGCNLKREVRLVELYAGTGRSIEPFRSWNDARIALLVDSNPVARDAYLTNFPGAPYRLAELGSATPSDVAAWAGGDIDVLLGCPPCQGFSESGLRRPDDPRNKHVTKFAEVALAARPRAVVMENVPTAAAASEFVAMVGDLERLGYRWTAAIINAVQYGSSQSRQRLIFVAVDRARGAEPVLAFPTHGAEGLVFSYSAKILRPMAAHVVEMLGVSPATQRLAKRLPQDFTGVLGPAPARTVLKDIEG